MSISGRMLQYRGKEEDFDADKMLPGMFAVSTDKKYVRMCFSPGVVARMATYEAFEEDMLQVQQILATCEDIQTAVEAFESLAEQHTVLSQRYSIESKSWAAGGTGTRTGENTDNSKYYSQQSRVEADRAKAEADRAASVAGIDVATPERAGIVKPDSITLDISEDGTIYNKKYPDMTVKLFASNNVKYIRICSITVNAIYINMPITFSLKGRASVENANIAIKFENINGTSPDVHTISCRGDKTYASKLHFYKMEETGSNYELWIEGTSYDMFSVSNISYGNGGMDITWLDSTNSNLPQAYRHYSCNFADISLTNNLLATVPGTALDAVQGKDLDDKITDVMLSLTNLIKIKTVTQTVKMPTGTSIVGLDPELPSGTTMLSITPIVSNTHIQTSVRNAIRTGININIYNTGPEITAGIRLDITYM